MPRPRRPVLIAAGMGAVGVAVAVAIAVALHPPQTPPPEPLQAPEEAEELVVLIRPGPIFHAPGPDGSLAGIDVDLLRQFAAEKKLALRFNLAASTADVLAAVARGEAHVGAGGLYRPPAAPSSDASDAAPGTRTETAQDPDAGVLWTSGYATAQPILIYNRDGYRPTRWNDLDGEAVAYVEDAGFGDDIAAARSAHPDIVWRALASPSTAGLIAQVSDGTIGYAVVGSLAASLARNVYLDFDVGFAAGRTRDVAWAVPARFGDLRQELDRFLARQRRDGTLARLAERYIPDRRQIQRMDAGALHERVRTLLPQYRPYFQDAQEQTSIEWRLLAAIAYQESQWDPAAMSETGVRGLMQITEDTAKHLGLRNLLDPAESVLGAARYLRALKDKLPPRIGEPDRTWLALAAFNIGLGHVEDARVLAQRQSLNPDLWSDVKKALPLLAIPEFYAQARQGYARGGMPVAFVDRVRAYYDVLLAQQHPHQPRLRISAEVPDPGPGAPDRVPK